MDSVKLLNRCHNIKISFKTRMLIIPQYLHIHQMTSLTIGSENCNTRSPKFIVLVLLLHKDWLLLTCNYPIELTNGSLHTAILRHFDPAILHLRDI